MKQILRKTLLVLVAGVLSSAAWAESIGNIDEGWFPNNYRTFTLAVNKKLSLNFVVNSTKNTENYQGWITKLRKGNDQIFFIQPSCGYWGTGGTWDTGAIYNANNYDWEGTNFRTNLQGATVAYELKRYNSQIILTEDVTTTVANGSKKFRHYFIFPDLNTSDDLLVDFGADAAVLNVSNLSQEDVVSDADVYPTILGQKVGEDNNTTAFWSAWSDYFTIEPNQSLTLRYKCYSNRINNYNGGVPYVTTDADRGATGYTEYFGLRPDNYVNVAGVNATSCNYGVVLNWNWATFREKVDGSTVTVTITRSGADVAIREEFAPADASTTLWEEYNQDCGDGTQNIRVFLTVEGAHLDLLSVSKTITAAGWATYCSPYALDFTNPIANLEAAYTITGHEGNSLTLSPVTGTIPAETGILLKGSGECLIPVVASSTTDVSTNKLQGVTTETNKEANTILVLLNGDNGVGFYKNNNAFTVGANTAYLNVGDVTASRSFYDLGEGTTAIENIKVGSKDNVYYNLQGQGLLYPTKGLYIVNGKKVIIK